MPERREEVTLTLDGETWVGWSSIVIRHSADKFSDVEFSAPFEPERSEFRRIFRPFGYAPVTVSIGGETAMVGTVMGVDPSTSPSSRSVAVTAYSLPGVLNDVTMPASAYPLEFNGLTLRQIAERCCSPFGVRVVFELDDEARSENEAYRRYLARVAGIRRRISARDKVRQVERARDDYNASPAPDEFFAAGWEASVAAAKSSRDYQQFRELDELKERRKRYELGVAGTGGGAAEKQAVLDSFDAQIAFKEAQLTRIPKFSGTALDQPFRRIAIRPEARVLEFLAKCAKQRNFIISDTRDGALLFSRGATPGAPVAHFVEGEPPLIRVTPNFSPQAMFSEMTAISKGRAGARSGAFTATNPHLSVLRPSTFSPDDTDSPDLEAAARARIGRMIAAAARYEIEVPTWRDPSGALWRENTTVTLTAPGAMVYRETEMTIRDVEFRYGSTQTAVLSLVLPGAFTGEIPEVLPWD